MSNQALSIGARLLEYCAMDVVFVAVDFEGTDGICGRPSNTPITPKAIRSLRNSQAGIAILDTRDLNKSPETVVTTRQFCVGPSWYCDTVPTKLLFGTSETVTLQSLSRALTDLLRFTDPITNALRPVVVIGHHLCPNSDSGDIACLNKLTDPSLRSPIIDYLDTYEDRVVLRPLGYLLGDPLKSGFRHPSLREILDYLDIPFANLHIAANDAMFTLRETLMVAVREHQNTDQDLSSTDRKVLSKLQEIALVPLSPPPGVKLTIDAFGFKRRVEKVAQCTRRKKKRRECNELRRQHQKAIQDERRKAEKTEDWTDLNGGIFPWDTDNEQIPNLVDDESLLEFDQTPISPGGESPSDNESDSEESSGCAYSSDEEAEDLLTIMCLKICPPSRGLGKDC